MELVAYKRGTVHISLFVILLIVGFWALVLYFLISKNIIKIPGVKKEAKVELKTEYNNPFKKETQYVNPFGEYKNPFNNI